MTLRIYDDTTHQAVPKEPTEAMFVSVDAVNDAEMERLAKSGSSVTQSSWVKTHLAAYQALIAVAPPHGAALPTREEIADAIYRVTINKASVGRITAHVVMTLEAADAILALIQHKVKG